MIRRITKIMIMAAAMVAGAAAITTTPATVLAQQVFESEEDGFRLQVPAGWVIDDVVNEPLEPYVEMVALLCLENESLPSVGGGSSCLGAEQTDLIQVLRWPELQSIPEFRNDSNSGTTITPTTDDLVALWIQWAQTSNQTSEMRLVNSTDIDEFRKTATLTYTYYDNAGTFLDPFDDATYGVEALVMFVLDPESRDTGYAITNYVDFDNTMVPPAIPGHSPAVYEILTPLR